MHTAFDAVHSLIQYPCSSDTAIYNATINDKIRYSNLAHVDDGCRQKLCI